jgi:hypothetical protein
MLLNEFINFNPKKEFHIPSELVNLKLYENMKPDIYLHRNINVEKFPSLWLELQLQTYEWWLKEVSYRIPCWTHRTLHLQGCLHKMWHTLDPGLTGSCFTQTSHTANSRKLHIHHNIWCSKSFRILNFDDSLIIPPPPRILEINQLWNIQAHENR